MKQYFLHPFYQTALVLLVQEVVLNPLKICSELFASLFRESITLNKPFTSSHFNSFYFILYGLWFLKVSLILVCLSSFYIIYLVNWKLIFLTCELNMINIYFYYTLVQEEKRHFWPNPTQSWTWAVV